MGQYSCGRSRQESMKQDEALRQQEIDASEMLALTMSDPVRCTFQARALDTVGALLRLVAVQLGLEAHLGGMMQLIFCDQPVTDHRSTLQDAGLRQDAVFQVLADVAYISAKHEQAQKVDLFQAVEGGRVVDIVTVCKWCPERVHARDRYMSTPLHLAAKLNQSKIVGLLLEAHADPNARHCRNKTPLDTARHFKHMSIVAMLKRAGAYETTFF
eukprot:TRINITY_DN40155_c0_g1_i2.p1 TRINITY_DN40155_c0_g1~~TRINITY_DN40155_c0_g1_i2.p1  ORF type:complete len:214 (-),score=65.47 TRINITY_DN40155_c0_g1_i2:70-711(-)